MLKRVSIQNFKSLKDVTLDLQKVNLLIGPNNSGKTNFLKALEFISLWMDGKIDNEFNFSQYIFRPQLNLSKGMNLELSAISDDIKKEHNYKLQLKPLGMSIDLTEQLWDISLENNEKIESTESEISYHPFFGLTLNGKQIEGDDFLPSRFIRVNNNAHTIGSQVLSELLNNVYIYKPDPNKLNKPGPVGTGEAFVNSDTSNIVGFLDLMLSRYRRTIFNQIELDLHKCINEFIEIKLDDVILTSELKKLYNEDKNNNSFKKFGLTNEIQNITYWADELSEGTLYFLSLLCIIHQPNPPKLLLLEEPEKGIHPRRIHEVMNFIFRLADEKDIQIILTTHNENVLNEFTSMPEAVFVFNKDEEGATYVHNLKSDIIDPSHERSRQEGLEEIDFTDDLGKNWMYGLLGGVPTEEL